MCRQMGGARSRAMLHTRRPIRHCRSTRLSMLVALAFSLLLGIQSTYASPIQAPVLPQLPAAMQADSAQSTGAGSCCNCKGCCRPGRCCCRGKSRHRPAMCAPCGDSRTGGSLAPGGGSTGMEEGPASTMDAAIHYPEHTPRAVSSSAATARVPKIQDPPPRG